MLANSVADRWASVPFFVVSAALAGLAVYMGGRVKTRRATVLGWVLLIAALVSLGVGLNLFGVSGDG